MAELNIADFRGGWAPGDDKISGRKNILLQMDNLELDSNGALSLAGGTNLLDGSYASPAHDLYSRFINGFRRNYAVLTDGNIVRDAFSIGTGGDTTSAAFGTAFNYTLIASGNKRIKDNLSAVQNLGILGPGNAPTFDTRTAIYTSTIPLNSAFVIPAAYSGSYSSPTLTLDTAATNAGVTAGQTYALGGAPLNWAVMSDGSDGSDRDFIEFAPYYITVTGTGPATLQIDFLTVAGNAAGDPTNSYYTTQISIDPTPFGVAVAPNWMQVTRDKFTKVGTDLKDWSTIYGVRISLITPDSPISQLQLLVKSDGFQFKGGAHSQNGTYVYTQINVNNTGSYIAKSVHGPFSDKIQLNNETAHIFYQDPTAIDAQINEVWIFRQGQFDEKPFRVIVIPKASWSAASVADPFSDQDAETLDITLNINLIGVESASISDKIYDILGPVNGRWYYFTEQFMYPSDINDPDLVDASLAIRTCGLSELYLWARQISDTTILVGTSVDIYVLSGTFATFPDGSVDIFYRPLKCKFPPLTKNAAVYGGAVYYLAKDGWRIIDSSGANPSLVSPNLDRLYRGETLFGYAPPNLSIAPRSASFPIVISQNKLFAFINGIAQPRIEIYDFIRQYWRTVNYHLGNYTACTDTQDGKVLIFSDGDLRLREACVSNTLLIDGVTKQTVVGHFPVLDDGTPNQRKDGSTLKIKLTSSDPCTVQITTDNNATNTVGVTGSPAFPSSVPFDISVISDVQLCKTYEVFFAATVSSFVLNNINIIYSLRPEQTNFIRVQSENYGTTARKRIATIPFQMDSMGNDVVVTAILDGAQQVVQTFNSNYKRSLNFEFAVSGNNLPIAKDYEYTIHSPGGLLEWFGFEPPRILETYPQQCKGFVIPVSNFGNAAKKRIRTWPFVLSAPLSNTLITFVPLIDGASGQPTTFLCGPEKKTYRYYFKTDVFGVDYNGVFSADGAEFEVASELALQPEIVQVLPVAKQFDQVGPEEFFRYGKIKMVELRILAFGSSIPFTIYFNDNTKYQNSFPVTDGKECTSFIMVPKGTSGNVVRVELGPTDFDFHRFYTRLQVTRSGKDTELEWITIG